MGNKRAAIKNIKMVNIDNKHHCKCNIYLGPPELPFFYLKIK